MKLPIIQQRKEAKRHIEENKIKRENQLLEQRITFREK